MADLLIDWKKAENVRLVEGKPLVFHCHHYNCHLQKTIEDSRIVDGKGIQLTAAREVAFEHFTKAFANHSELKEPKERLAFAENFFRLAGFGLVDFSKVSKNGGFVTCPSSHYAKGWVVKWGKRKTPMCFFNAGWIAGVLAAAYDGQRFTYDVQETMCEAVTGKGCTFQVGVR